MKMNNTGKRGEKIIRIFKKFLNKEKQERTIKLLTWQRIKHNTKDKFKT